MGAELYEDFAESLELFPLGEHLFAVDIFGAETLDSDAYLTRFHTTRSFLTPALLSRLRDRTVPDFLDYAAESVGRNEPDVVGLTCTFNQVLPSLALARRLKLARPATLVLLGGACVHGEMGLAYADGFAEYVDYVFTGEADESFVEWLRAVDGGQLPTHIRGVAQTGQVHRTHEAATARPTLALDHLPIPDYAPFFEQRAADHHGSEPLPPVRHLPYESSRGCWWGEKHHCTFCGLNNEGLLYRRKSADRVLTELTTLARAHGMTTFMAADNILDFRAYHDLLIKLGEAYEDYSLYYEIKANLRRADVAALARAHVTGVQPGIESFSDHVLQLMRKGSTAVSNIQLLKWLAEYGINVDYNVLVGFPGETRSDYGESIRIMRALFHLPPPTGTPTVARVDRFSPFFDESEALGIRGVRASEQYRHLIPDAVLPAGAYAYFFDRDLSDLAALQDLVFEMQEVISEWRAARVRRTARLGPGFVEILSSRGGQLARRTLRDARAAVFVLCDSQRSLPGLRAELGAESDVAGLDAVITELMEAGLLIRSGSRIVNTVPFVRPHTDAELTAWLAANARTSDVVPGCHVPDDESRERPVGEARADAPDPSRLAAMTAIHL